jgi:hypothetical protein
MSTNPGGFPADSGGGDQPSSFVFRRASPPGGVASIVNSTLVAYETRVKIVRTTPYQKALKRLRELGASNEGTDG